MSGDTDPEGRTISAPMLPISPESSGTLDPTPKLLAGRYELLGMLGAGAMGTVYRACDKSSADRRPGCSRRARLDRHARAVPPRGEARALESRIETSRAPTTSARTAAIASSRWSSSRGEMLAARLARQGRMPSARWRRSRETCCAGLAAALPVGVIHRDLKPENVIVAKDGHAVITDFGIARAAQAEAASRTVGIVGTPGVQRRSRSKAPVTSTCAPTSTRSA